MTTGSCVTCIFLNTDQKQQNKYVCFFFRDRDIDPKKVEKKFLINTDILHVNN